MVPQGIRLCAGARPEPSMCAKVVVTKDCSVATEHPLASLAGLEAMRAGGNAFDAAVAASFALSVVLPHLNGLGGDFFALFQEGRSGKVQCLNGSGWAPSSYTVDSLRAHGLASMPDRGPGSAVVPGLVGAVEELHRRFGRSSFSGLVARSIDLAEEGFPVSRGLAGALARHRARLSREALLAFAASGQAPRAGEVLRQRGLAERLREIARGGAEAFYAGAAGEEISRAIASSGFELDPKDMEFAPEWAEPLTVEYRGRQVFEVPPNSMGAAALRILKEIEGTRPPPPDSFERVRLVTQATIAALEARDSFIADPRFVPFDLKEFLASRRTSRGRPLTEGDTTYFAVADAEGNLLSCIQSLFQLFGSGVYLRDSGFFLNNRASAFSFDGPNVVAPRKRPAHTLSALLLSRGPGEAPSLAMGTSGGEHRPQLHALFVSNVVDYGMDVEGALAYPRFLWDGENTSAERGYRLGAGSPGLRVVEYPSRLGVAQGIALTDEGKKAYSDIRGDGEPAGF